MDEKMRIDLKILDEIQRYKTINRYINEQELPPPPGGEVPPPPGGELPPPPGGEVPPPPSGEGGVSPAPPTAPPTPVDIDNDPDVEKIEDEGESKSEKKEIEVTDLVKSQKSVEEKQEQYFDNLFQHLNDLESKLASMDEIISKLNSIESKVEKYRVKTPEEKMELRSLDSGPFNQKLSQFFQEKEDEFEDMGREQYIITPEDVESYSQPEIRKSFREFDGIDDPDKFNNSGFQKIY